MSNTLTQPSTPEEHAEVDYGEHVIWRLVGSKIISFGANDAGDIFLSTTKGDEVNEFIIGLDERGEVALFEGEKPEGEAQ